MQKHPIHRIYLTGEQRHAQDRHHRGKHASGRKAEAVSYEFAKTRSDAEYELVDIAEFNLPLLDKPVPPLMGKYQNPHTQAWSAKIDAFNGFVFVTPEYNHGTSGALKNAIEFLWKEWNHKAAGFVSYGGAGGARAAEQLRLVMGELMVADVRSQVLLSLHNDFENYTIFKPGPHHERSVHAMLDEVVAWSGALKTFRSR